MKIWNQILRFICVSTSFIVLFYGFQRLLSPKYVDTLVEGHLVGEYYLNEHHNQVLFIGDCEVYENFSPITLWEEYGISSYIRGGPQQLIWQSYYFLEEMLQYETPKVVIFNVLAMKYSVPQSEAYNRLNLDGMMWSLTKWESVKISMMDEEDFWSYVFPILRYHDRIVELGEEDLQYFFDKNTVFHNGYRMETGVQGVTTIPSGQILGNYEFSDICYEYLDKMRILCETQGIHFVLVKAPSIYPHWYEEWEEQIFDYAQEYGLLYLNFLDLVAEIGLDYQVDTYDGGLHLNVYGAEKLSYYLGRILSDEYGLEDLRSDQSIARAWQDKISYYYFCRNN